MSAAGGVVIVTDCTAGAGFTVTVVLPLLVASKSDVAVIVADPAAIAVTSPAGDTVAIAVLEEDQLTAVDAPLTAFTVAVS